MKYYKPKYFKPHELVDVKTYNHRLFDQDLLKFADWLRERYGRMVVNDWKTNGSCQWRGLRTPDAVKYYNKNSQHTEGKALDFFPLDTDAETIIQDLKLIDVPYITRVEYFKGITWIHADTLLTGQKEIRYFKP